MLHSLRQTPTSLDLMPIASAKSPAEMWRVIYEGLQPAPERQFTNGADFAAWLKSLSHRSGKKDLVLIFDEGDALAELPEELRSEFLSVLRSQKTNRAMGPADPSEAPVKVRVALLRA